MPAQAEKYYKQKAHHKVCVLCQVAFIASSPLAKWCPQCKRAKLRIKETRLKCVICGGEFFGHKSGMYCSVACRDKARNRNTLRLIVPLVREYFLEKGNFSCNHCGISQVEFHLHHTIPLSEGGPHTEDNIELLCIPCHQEAHSIRLPRKRS